MGPIKFENNETACGIVIGLPSNTKFSSIEETKAWIRKNVGEDIY